MTPTVCHIFQSDEVGTSINGSNFAMIISARQIMLKWLTINNQYTQHTIIQQQQQQQLSTKISDCWQKQYIQPQNK